MYQSEGDIVGAAPIDGYLVVGWFTEDDIYRPLAEMFAVNLDEHGVPFHLYAKPSGDGWNPNCKPTVALDAIDAYPGKTVILMDVDCRINANIEPLHDLPGDVGIFVQTRRVRRRGRVLPRPLFVEASSRVVVFRPFAGAVSFAREWERLCQLYGPGDDEGPMIRAYLNCPWVAYHQVLPAYAAQEPFPGAIIEHDSAHDRQMQAQRPATVAGWLKAFEKRWLRTGRTKRERHPVQAI